MSAVSESIFRVLVVDDNPDIHNDISKTLSPRQVNQRLDELESCMFGEAQAQVISQLYETEHAYQGQDALKMVMEAGDADTAFDLAIVDMRMPPGWDGVQTVERLWEYDPDLHIIICTAFSDYSWDEINQRLGSPNKLLIIKKPFDDCELLQAVRALGDRRRLQLQVQSNLDNLQLLVKQRSRELEALHLESESLLDAISAGLVAYDAFGLVTRWNDAAEKMFGVSAEQSLNKLVMELELPWQEPEAFADFFRCNQYLIGKRIELVLNNIEGEPITVELSLHPVSMNGLPVGGLMLIDDVTIRRQLEQQLNQSQKLEAVGQLAAGIAHEINTPMQYVGDNVQFLHSTFKKVEPTLRLIETLVGSELNDDTAVKTQISKTLGNVKLTRVLEQMPKAIGDVEQGIANVVRIVQAMKELSHPGAEAPAPMDIHRILESAIVVSRSEWKHIANVETDFAQNPPGMVGFANQLQQVVLNLLVNATHAVEARHKGDASVPGKIRLSTMVMKDRFLISIQDNGCGIPDKIRTRVYDPFFTTKDVGKGTGQGLAIAHQIIVNNHQGRLWFESEVGQGTTFFIELPAAPTQAII